MFLCSCREKVTNYETGKCYLLRADLALISNMWSKAEWFRLPATGIWKRWNNLWKTSKRSDLCSTFNYLLFLHICAVATGSRKSVCVLYLPSFEGNNTIKGTVLTSGKSFTALVTEPTLVVVICVVVILRLPNKDQGHILLGNSQTQKEKQFLPPGASCLVLLWIFVRTGCVLTKSGKTWGSNKVMLLDAWVPSVPGAMCFGGCGAGYYLFRAFYFELTQRGFLKSCGTFVEPVGCMWCSDWNVITQ